MSPSRNLDRISAAGQLDDFLAVSADHPAQPNCGDAEPELFFPRSQVTALAQDAIEYCLDCPLIDACRKYAMAWDVDGIWGGTTKPARDRERARLRQRPVPVTLAGFLASGPVEPRRAMPRTKRAS